MTKPSSESTSPSVIDAGVYLRRSNNRRAIHLHPDRAISAPDTGVTSFPDGSIHITEAALRRWVAAIDASRAA